MNDVWSRRASWWRVVMGGVSWEGGLWACVKFEGGMGGAISREGLGGHVCMRGCCIVWGGWCCPAERGTKAPGGKYLPRIDPAAIELSRFRVAVQETPVVEGGTGS